MDQWRFLAGAPTSPAHAGPQGLAPNAQTPREDYTVEGLEGLDGWLCTVLFTLPVRFLVRR